MRKLDQFFKRTMIISPHGDDEVLGCGGLIARILSEVEDSEVKILLFSTGDIFNESQVKVTAESRAEEFYDMTDFYRKSTRGKISGEILFPGMELNLESVGMMRSVSTLDNKISEFNPTAVLTCYASHHQDHQFVCNATIAALRPTPYDNVVFKSMYEYGYYEAWNPMNQVKMSKVYIDISDYVDIKVKAFECYQSQQKAHPRDLLLSDNIRKYAQFRGLECGVSYAEVLFPLTIRI